MINQLLLKNVIDRIAYYVRKHTQIQYTYINRLINIASKYDELKKKSIEVDPHSENIFLQQ